MSDQKIDKLRAEVERLTRRKDGAYDERMHLVAALARLFPSGTRDTTSPGWTPSWKGCVYIDLPTGQVAYHYHTRHQALFEGLPPYERDWDGHDKDAAHARLAALWGGPDALGATNDH